MKLKLLPIVLFFCLDCFGQDTIRYNNVWYTTKESAYHAADSLGKDIIFVFGANWCGCTIKALDLIGKEPLRTQLNEKYVFLYDTLLSNNRWIINNYEHLTPISITPFSIPVVTIISRHKKDYPISRGQGCDVVNVKDSLSILVLNDKIFYNNFDVICSYDGYGLKIYSPYDNELIYIYNIRGELIFTLQKLSNSFYIFLNLPKGNYIIIGKNWSKKLIIY